MHPSGAVPDTLRVMLMRPIRPERIEWSPHDVAVRDSAGNALWLDHPIHGRRVDVVALPLSDVSWAELHPYDLTGSAPQLAIGPASEVSVVGFPFGLTGGGAFGIWTRGFVASEPEIELDDLPKFLIDARTRQGQSGSPVIAYSNGGMTPMADGRSAVFDGPVANLLGVYSGRVNEQSDLGTVWKVEALRQILRARHPGHGGL